MANYWTKKAELLPDHLKHKTVTRLILNCMDFYQHIIIVTDSTVTGRDWFTAHICKLADKQCSRHDKHQHTTIFSTITNSTSEAHTIVKK